MAAAPDDDHDDRSRGADCRVAHNDEPARRDLLGGASPAREDRPPTETPHEEHEDADSAPVADPDEYEPL